MSNPWFLIKTRKIIFDESITAKSGHEPFLIIFYTYSCPVECCSYDTKKLEDACCGTLNANDKYQKISSPPIWLLV